MSGNKEIVEFLISKGADLNAKTNDRWTVLHYAVYSGDRESVEFLIAKGVDLNTKDNNGDTPLDVAMDIEFFSDRPETNELTEIIELLKQHGAVSGSSIK